MKPSNIMQMVFQVWSAEAAQDSKLEIIGRILEDVRVGDCLVGEEHIGNPVTPVLTILEILAYGKSWKSVSAGWTAKLVVDGSAPMPLQKHAILFRVKTSD